MWLLLLYQPILQCYSVQYYHYIAKLQHYGKKVIFRFLFHNFLLLPLVFSFSYANLPLRFPSFWYEQNVEKEKRKGKQSFVLSFFRFCEPCKRTCHACKKWKACAKITYWKEKLHDKSFSLVESLSCAKIHDKIKSILIFSFSLHVQNYHIVYCYGLCTQVKTIIVYYALP